MLQACEGIAQRYVLALDCSELLLQGVYSLRWGKLSGRAWCCRTTFTGTVQAYRGPGMMGRA